MPIIECKIKRPRGTHVTLGGEDYFFVPTDEPGKPHLCRVDDPAHARRLLSIKDGYREWTHPAERLKRPASGKAPEEVAKDEPAPAPSEPNKLNLLGMSDEELARVSVSEVAAWGRSIGANPNNKSSIQAAAEHLGITGLETRKNETNMLRELAGKFRDAGIDPTADKAKG